MPQKCCVKNCTAQGQTMHRLPNPNVDTELFFLWLQILGVKNFHNKTPMQIYKDLRVCFAHFKPSCKNPGQHTLHRYAIPTIEILDAEVQVTSSTSPSTSEQTE